MSCAKMISWLVNHADLKNQWIINWEGNLIVSFQVKDLEKRYPFQKIEALMNYKWFEKVTRGMRCAIILQQWITKGKYLMLPLKF